MFATDAADRAPSPVFHVKLDAGCSLGDCGTRRAARCANVGPESGGTSGGEYYCPDLFIALGRNDPFGVADFGVRRTGLGMAE